MEGLQMNAQTDAEIAARAAARIIGDVPLLKEALQARFLILSTVAGRYAREAWQAIIDRKCADVAGVGHTVWAMNSQAARPDAVQSFCKEHGPCHVLFLTKGHRNKPGSVTIDAAKRYSIDGRSPWLPLPGGLSPVTGLRTRFTTGLWLEELEQVHSRSIALGPFLKQDGQRLTEFSNINSAYPVERVGPVQEGDYNILAVGRLAPPFAVYLRRQ
jgi:hypothetical protein